MNFEAEIADEDANGKDLMYELKEKCSRRTQLRSKYMYEAIQETNDGSNSKTLISIKECLGIFFAEEKFRTLKRDLRAWEDRGFFIGYNIGWACDDQSIT